MASPSFCKNNSSNGFTVAELLVAIGLLTAIFLFCAFFDAQNQRMFSFEADRDAVLAALRRARALSINSVCAGAGCIVPKTHGVHFDPSKKEALIFQGNNFSERDREYDEKVEFENRAAYIEAPLPLDIIFLASTGNSGLTSIALRDGYGHYAGISVSELGRIDWQ
jgi:hypothetical protein